MYVFAILFGGIVLFVSYALVRSLLYGDKLSAKQENDEDEMFNPANGSPMLINTDIKGNPKGFSYSDMFDYI